MSKPPSSFTQARRSSSRSSLNKPLNWLHRSSSSGKRVSNNSFQISSPSTDVERAGTLGNGATIVRTPQDALSTLTSPSSSTEELNVVLEHQPHIVSPRHERTTSENDVRRSSLRHNTSPRDAVPVLSSPSEWRGRAQKGPHPPPSISTSVPSPGRSSLKQFRDSGYFSPAPPVPPLPSNVSSSPVQPKFEAVLISDVPDHPDTSKTIVTLETSTQTYRTTFNTLTSRSSSLATYLANLIPRSRKSSVGSVYSSRSDDSRFDSFYKSHLQSSGLVSKASDIHIFLDRPSAPYAHILTYLRTPSMPECPAILPHAAQLISNSPSRLEALLELRDEAKYLNLQELHKLCSEELRTRQATHTRAFSGSSGNSSTFAREVAQQKYDAVDPIDSPHQRSLSLLLEELAHAPLSPPNATFPPMSPPSSIHSRARSAGPKDRRVAPAGWI